MLDGNLIVFEASEDNSGHYQCIDEVNNTTLLDYSFIVNSTAYNKYIRKLLCSPVFVCLL